MDSEDQRCEYAKTIGDGLVKMMQSYRGKVEEFLLQDLKPDTQRREIEEVARVVITPERVEIYTFDDKVYFVEFGGTKIRKMNWVNTIEGGIELEEDLREEKYELAGILRCPESTEKV